MASTYSSNLKIELMATGSDSGTWGTNTNTNLGTAIEQAIIGYGNPDYTSDANLTITITNSSASQAARCLVLNVTSVFGSLTATRELIVPTIQKQYIVQNNTTGGQSITVKTSAGTGITVPNGRKAHLYVDGTNVIQMFDFVDINGGAIDGTAIGATSASTGAFTSLTASGATTLDGTVALGNASGDLITVPGTVNSNLIFTDNLFDIGASGATRPRNLFLAGAATVAGNLSVGGTLTLTGGVNLNGNVTVGDTSADTLTINSTITSNLIFTDNTYDIGASGATRPRNLFLAGNATVGGAQTLTGALTVDSTTDSTSITTGSVQTDGGLGVAKALFVGTTANVAGAVTLSGGTANGVAFLNGSKVVTSGSALTFDGTTATTPRLAFGGTTLPAAGTATLFSRSSDNNTYLQTGSGNSFLVLDGSQNTMLQLAPTVLGFNISNTEQMRLTSTGLGIGTSSPTNKLDILTGDNTGLSVRSTNYSGSFGPSGLGGMALTAAGAYPLFFYISGATRATLDSSGNLGIGTSSPVSLKSAITLQVFGNAKLGDANDRGLLSLGDISSTGANCGIWRGAAGAYGSAGNYLSLGGYDGITFTTGNADIASQTERMRLDSSGNLGLGVTPSAWFTGGGYKVMQIGAGMAFDSGNDFRARITANGFVNSGGDFRYLNTGFASSYTQTSGQHQFFTAPSGTAGNAITFTQAMTLDASGRLVLGATSADGIITLGSASYGTGAIYQTTKNNGGSFYYGIESSAGASIVNGSSAYASLLFTQGATSLQFGTNNNIRATIDSSGNLGLGVTPSAWSTSAQTALQVYTAGVSGNGGGNTASRFTHGCYLDGSTWKYQYTGVAPTRYEVTGANAGSTHSWSVAAGGTAGNAITFTQAMTLDASGQLGVGTTSPQKRIHSVSAGAGLTEVLRVGNSQAIAAGVGVKIGFQPNNDFVSNGLIGASISAVNTSGGAGNDISLVFATGSGGSESERARIDSSGNLLVGTTSSSSKLTVDGATTSSGGTTSKTTTVTTTFITIGTSLGPTGAGVAVVSGYQTSSGNQGVFLVSFCQGATNVISSTDNTATTPSFQVVGNVLQMKTTSNTLAITCCLLF